VQETIQNRSFTLFKTGWKIDLVGKSQLIQTEGSILDVNSSGSIIEETNKDNQTNTIILLSSRWSINTTANNIDYSIARE
jgi:hypothetical protein